MCADFAPVFVFVPIVSSVDGMDNFRLNQTGVLLTLPASCDPTCTTEENKSRGKYFHKIERPTKIQTNMQRLSGIPT